MILFSSWLDCFDGQFYSSKKLAHFFICSLTMAPFSLGFHQGLKKKPPWRSTSLIRNPISRLGLSKVHEFLHGRVMSRSLWSPTRGPRKHPKLPGNSTDLQKFNPSIYQVLLQLSANAGKVNYKVNWLDAEQVLINPKGLRRKKTWFFLLWTNYS